MGTATCFFCYAWGTDERYEKLEFLRSYIQDRARNFEVILDKHTYEDNQDFNELRERIWSYDLVIVFCTPDFKSIIMDSGANSNKNREVLKEYKIIEERYRKNGNSVFPVVLEGTKDTSLLDIFYNRNARVFEGFNIAKNDKGKLYLPRENNREFNKFIGKIINTAIHNCEDKSENYKTAQEALDYLFGLTDNVNIPDSCLVKPDLYRQIRGQTCLFVAGRKGSGKSTFIYNFSKMDSKYFKDHYKKMVPLSAESFQHEYAYQALIMNHRADKAIIEPHSLMCLFWQVYFVLHCIIIIRAEIDDCNIERTDKRYAIFNRITKKLIDKIGVTKQSYESISNSIIPKALFMAAVEMIDNRFQTALDEVKDEELIMTSYSAKFTLKSIIEEVFGEKDTNAFIKALAQCKRKIMISLDGFDTHSEDFRITTERLLINSEEYRNRKEYEALFFRTLLEVVTQFKRHNTNDSVADAFGNLVDFCIVLPKDRYDMIIDSDRDSFKKRFGTLSWSALELLELLTKRLEYLIETIEPAKAIDKSSDYFHRMDSALEFFPGLPSSISMTVNGNVISMSLFNYILRSSFWRPRDVISNLSRIMAQMIRVTNDNWVTSNNRLTEDDVKLSIKSNAEKIIDEEFIGEYRYVFHNIDDVLKELQGIDEQMSVRSFCDILKGIRFNTAYSYDMSMPESKLRVLYQLGVIGLLYNKNIAAHQRYLNHICFEFNEGMAPFEDFLKNKAWENSTVSDVSIIVNPIFARRLMLNYNTKELIGNWSADYIRSNHINKESIHGM